MSRVLLIFVLSICGGIMMSAASFADAPAVGDPAPSFELKGSDGKTYRLSEFKDKKVVIVAWYPKAFTGG